jgi:hypothetical protein
MATPGVETSDAPSGVTLLGRWFLITGTGFAVAEMTDAKALVGYAAEWSEFPAIEATPWWWTPKLAKSLTRPGVEPSVQTTAAAGALLLQFLPDTAAGKATSRRATPRVGAGPDRPTPRRLTPPTSPCPPRRPRPDRGTRALRERRRPMSFPRGVVPQGPPGEDSRAGAQSVTGQRLVTDTTLVCGSKPS